MKLHSLTLAVVALVLSGTAFAQAPIIQISGANFRPMPLAVQAPNPGDVPRAEANDYDEALSFDLAASGLFQLLDRKSFLADSKEGLTTATIQFARWADVGAEALVKTTLSRDGDNVHGELHLYSVASGRDDLKLTKSVPAKDVRRLGHYFADEIFRHYTREPGPFQSRLTFVKKTNTGKDIWVSDWDGRNGVKLTSGGINLLPTLTPDSSAAVYTSYKHNKPDLWIQKIGGEPRVLVESGAMATGAAFSPDGRHVAYSLAQGESAQIFVANADGSGAKAITDTPYFINSSPAWSPDGKRIAFVSNRAGSPQIYVMNADGSGVKRLTFQGNYNQTPDWSPRGDLIAFTARDERNAFDLFTVNVENGKIARLTQDQGNNEEPTFSPNGRLIVFTSTRNGGSQLFVMTADGNDQRALPSEGGMCSTPDWGSLVKQ